MMELWYFRELDPLSWFKTTNQSIRDSKDPSTKSETAFVLICTFLWVKILLRSQ